MDKIIIEGIDVQTIIGVNKDERENPQNISIYLTLFVDTRKAGLSDCILDTVNYSSITKAVVKYTSTSRHYTLEALATGIARICCIAWNVNSVKVRVEKPAALKLAKFPAVEIERTKEFFKDFEKNAVRTVNSDTFKQVYIALGSNIGNRIATILKALDFLSSEVGKVVTTSFLYETLPQYVLDQPTFLNAVCLVETSLMPEDLLNVLKKIESMLDRQPTIRYGPRTVDLDILYYGNEIIDNPTLTIPHPRIAEREFVLRPLLDIAPDLVHPILFLTTNQMMNFQKSVTKPKEHTVHRVSSTMDHLPLRVSSILSKDIEKIIPVVRGNNDTKKYFSWHCESRTFLMGVLNVTPDSFSDANLYLDTQKAVDRALEMIDEGADVIDIGGQSTKPGATRISESDELDRILPVIKILRSDELIARTKKVLISVDTFYSFVARETIKAGADMINDVSAGEGDKLMFSTIASLSVPYVMMHRKPTPTFTARKSGQEFEGSFDIMDELSIFFKDKISQASKAGINKWQIILDPGLGFDKLHEESLRIVRDGWNLKKLGFPILIGPSKKGFAGCGFSSNHVSDEGRVWGTAAVIVAAVNWGVTMVRVHNVKEMKYSIQTAESIYRDDHTCTCKAMNIKKDTNA